MQVLRVLSPSHMFCKRSPNKSLPCEGFLWHILESYSFVQKVKLHLQYSAACTGLLHARDTDILQTFQRAKKMMKGLRHLTYAEVLQIGDEKAVRDLINVYKDLNIQAGQARLFSAMPKDNGPKLKHRRFSGNIRKHFFYCERGQALSQVAHRD